jgi:hypothetical protein
MNLEKSHGLSRGAVRWMALLVALFCASSVLAQSPVSRKAEKDQIPTASPAPISDEDLIATREELFKLLRMTPKLTGVVAHDPSLLGDQEYVNRNNPELAKFLQNHQEIARNPDFYLFSNFESAGKRGERLSLVRGVVSLDVNAPYQEYNREFMHDAVPFLVFVCFLAALLWILRVVLENRRWSRVFKVQTDIYNKLLDRFSNNEELLAYMQGGAGKGFMESVSLPSNFRSYTGTSLGRILFPLQFGVVLTLAGLGLIWVRGSVPEAASPLLVFGTLALMLGLGFVISAGLSLLLVRHLGLLPQKAPSQSQESASPKTKEQL